MKQRVHVDRIVFTFKNRVTAEHCSGVNIHFSGSKFSKLSPYLDFTSFDLPSAFYCTELNSDIFTGVGHKHPSEWCQ